MKLLLKIILFLLLPGLSVAQQNLADSQRKIFLSSKDDSILYTAASHLYDYYEEQNRDSALFYADQCVLLARRNNKRLNEAYFLNRKAYQQLDKGYYAESLYSLLDAFSISENKSNDKYYWEVDQLGSTQPQKRLYALCC